MKRQIRIGVFETNSSSVHSLTIVTAEEFAKFKDGELKTFDDYSQEYETYERTYTTKSGDEIVAFGYYGHD